MTNPTEHSLLNSPMKDIRDLISPARMNADVIKELKIIADLDRV